jgi:hypothetical protein
MRSYTDRYRNEKMKGRRSMKDGWKTGRGIERKAKKLIDIKIGRKE